MIKISENIPKIVFVCAIQKTQIIQINRFYFILTLAGYNINKKDVKGDTIYFSVNSNTKQVDVLTTLIHETDSMNICSFIERYTEDIQLFEVNTYVTVIEGIYKGFTGKITSYDKYLQHYVIDDVYLVHETCIEECNNADNRLFNVLYVTHKQAVLLSKLGFDFKCMYYYDNEDGPENNIWLNINGTPLDHNISIREVYSAPTLDLVQKWLREKKYHIIIEPDNTMGISNTLFSYKIYHQVKGFENHMICVDKFKTYEEALSNAIDKILDVLNKEK